MSYKLRPAITSEAKPLIGLYAESGGGKTYGALLIAHGFCGGDMSQVAMIETEAGRGEAFADDPVVGGYQVVPIRGNFSPIEYGKAISAVESAGSRVCIIDSASHEWEGVGGVLSMAAENQAKGNKGVLVWQKPKIEHQREFMLRMMQSPIPLIIVCMRAKYPMEQVTEAYLRKWRDAGGTGKPPNIGDWARSKDLDPKQSDDILFEMFVHGWLDKEHIFHGTKYTTPVMREIFRDGELITADTGKRLAQWASGQPPKATQQQNMAAGAGNSTAQYITPDQALALEAKCTELDIPLKNFKAAAKVDRLSMILASDYERALKWITATHEKRRAEVTT